MSSCVVLGVIDEYIFFFAGYIWAEIKQLWDEGAYEYVHDMWNILDFVTNSLYIATLTLRVIAYVQVSTELYSLLYFYSNFFIEQKH